jgi:transcriptional regulator with XRE-family HTH domain
VARRAGIAKSSISVWENDLHQPRIPDLTAVLTTLGVGSHETHVALSRIHAPRAAVHQRALLDADAAIEGGGETAPTPGRLLRTIRERRGVSLRRLARSIGRTPTAIVQWETRGMRPSPGALAALLAYLEPEEAEAEWLRSRFSRLAPPGSRDGAALDTLEAWLEGFKGTIRDGHHALDLDFLLWEMQVCGWLTARRDAALELLRQGRSEYALWLAWEDRLTEANEYAASALRLGPSTSRRGLSKWTTVALHVRACHEARSPQCRRPESAVRLLSNWLGMPGTPAHRSALLRELAQFAYEANEMAFAITASEQALRLADRTGDEEYNRLARSARIEIATRAGLWSEALSLIAIEPPNAVGIPRILHWFRWVDLLTAMDDVSAADDYLRRIYADMERDGYRTPSLLGRAENADRNLEHRKCR